MAASIMIGGKPEVYEHVRPMLESASAQVNGEPSAVTSVTFLLDIL